MLLNHKYLDESTGILTASHNYPCKILSSIFTVPTVLQNSSLKLFALSIYRFVGYLLDLLRNRSRCQETFQSEVCLEISGSSDTAPSVTENTLGCHVDDNSPLDINSGIRRFLLNSDNLHQQRILRLPGKFLVVSVLRYLRSGKNFSKLVASQSLNLREFCDERALTAPPSANTRSGRSAAKVKFSVKGQYSAKGIILHRTDSKKDGHY